MVEPLAISPKRTPEQHAVVRRRAVPLATAAVICSLGGLAALLLQPAAPAHIPPALGSYLAWFAIMMGGIILLYAKGTPRTGFAAILCVGSIVLGIAGTFVFMMRTIESKAAAQTAELANVSAIANAARQYAAENGGLYPPDLLVLLEQQKIMPAVLHFPYEQFATSSPADIEKAVYSKEFTSREKRLQFLDEHSDYQYFPGDLRLVTAATATAPAATGTAPSPPDASTFSQIVIVTRRYPIERKELSIAYTDGRPEFIDLEEAEKILKASNRAREALGFAPVRPPETVQKALDLEHQKPAQ